MGELYQPYASYQFEETDWFKRCLKLLDLTNVTTAETVLPFGIAWKFSSGFSLKNSLQNGLQNIFILSEEHPVANIKESIFKHKKSNLDLIIYSDITKPFDTDCFLVYNSRLKLLITYGTDHRPVNASLNICLPPPRTKDLTLIQSWTNLPLIIHPYHDGTTIHLLINLTSDTHYLHEYTNKFLSSVYKIAATECLWPDLNLNKSDKLVLSWI